VPLVDKPVGNRSIVFCEVETSDGTVGYGMTEYFLTHAIKAAIDHHFAPLMIGMDLTDVEKIHHKVGHVLNPRAMTGVVSCALSCIDIALWDAHGKINGKTVAALLGGFRDHAEAYVTFGFPNYDIDGLVDAAKHQIKLGAQKLKMVVAAHPGGWKEDVRRVRAVRDAIGSDIELMCDANYEFSPPDARMFAQAVEECDLSWFEEPLWQNDARARRAPESDPDSDFCGTDGRQPPGASVNLSNIRRSICCSRTARFSAATPNARRWRTSGRRSTCRSPMAAAWLPSIFT
jgi:L-alanine-DL-glutamate epimerase-like enolase superfamily enzyme